MDNFNIEKIHKTVWVFKNAIKNTEDMIEYFSKNKEWSDWYTFGIRAQGTGFKVEFNNFPTQEEWEDKKDIDGNILNLGKFENQINDLFYQVTSLYIQENPQDFEDWVYQGWDIAKYTEHPNDKLAMMYHTDFQRNISYSPGEKFGITAVFYLNDNYEGGEVLFRFLNSEDINIVEEDYYYKPKNGDIVVFNSGHPHYHGVKSVTKGEKYIIRTYWRYNYSGDPIWIKLMEKYGEEVWSQKELERKKFNEDPKNIFIINDIPFWTPFEEYYKEEIRELGI